MRTLLLLALGATVPLLLSTALGITPLSPTVSTSLGIVTLLAGWVLGNILADRGLLLLPKFGLKPVHRLWVRAAATVVLALVPLLFTLTAIWHFTEPADRLVKAALSTEELRFAGWTTVGLIFGGALLVSREMHRNNVMNRAKRDIEEICGKLRKRADGASDVVMAQAIQSYYRATLGHAKDLLRGNVLLRIVLWGFRARRAAILYTFETTQEASESVRPQVEAVAYWPDAARGYGDLGTENLPGFDVNGLRSACISTEDMTARRLAFFVQKYTSVASIVLHTEQARTVNHTYGCQVMSREYLSLLPERDRYWLKFRSYCAFPLKLADKICGVMFLGCNLPGAFLLVDEMQIERASVTVGECLMAVKSGFPGYAGGALTCKGRTERNRFRGLVRALDRCILGGSRALEKIGTDEFWADTGKRVGREAMRLGKRSYVPAVDSFGVVACILHLVLPAVAGGLSVFTWIRRGWVEGMKRITRQT